MKHLTVFHLISNILSKANIKVVLIGGFAVNHYNVTRQTIDIDFLCTKENFSKIKDLLEEEGYRVKRSEDNFVQLENKTKSLMDVDFMFVDQETFNKIKESSRKINIAGIQFAIPSLLHLIALKLHSIKNNPKREITDLPDIVRLIVNNDIDINDGDFRNLFLKYGTKELYGRIGEII